MNETVREILNKSKHDFLVAHGLYTKEYAPYKVRIVGYDADNPNSSDLVEYVVYSKKKMAKNDIITITYKGVNKKIKIQSGEYIENQNIPDEYNLSETDFYFPNHERRYKINVIDITNEEYELLKRELPSVASNETSQASAPALTTICDIIAVLFIIAGFISTFVMGDAFGGQIGWIVFIAGILSAMQFFVFAKIIELLDRIAKK